MRMLPDKKSEIVVHLPTDTDDTTVNDDATKVNSTGDSVEDEIEDVRAAFLDTPRSSNKTMVGEISSGLSRSHRRHWTRWGLDR